MSKWVDIYDMDAFKINAIASPKCGSVNYFCGHLCSQLKSGEMEMVRNNKIAYKKYRRKGIYIGFMSDIVQIIGQ